MKKIVVEMLTKRGDNVDISNARLVSGMVLPDLDGNPQGALLKLIFAEEEKLIVVPDIKVDTDQLLRNAQ